MDKTTPPVPQPRRHIITNDESRKSAYENVHIDFINKNIDINNDNLQSNRKSKIQQNKTFLLSTTTTTTTPTTTTSESTTSSSSGSISTTSTAQPLTITDDNNFSKFVLSEMNNLNLDKNKNIATKTIPETTRINNLNDAIVNHPIPAPRRVTSNTSKAVDEEIYANSGNENASVPEYVPPVSPSGAISKIPNITRKAPDTPPQSSSSSPIRTRQFSPNDFYVAPPQLEKSKSNTSVNSSTSGHSSKYSNPSPGDLLKSLSATSKLLSESISERVQSKTKDAKQKFDHLHTVSKSKINETTKTASKKLKNVRKNLYKIGDNFSLTRPDKSSGNKSNKNDHSFSSNSGEYNLERPQTMPVCVNDEIFQSISFYSPLNAKSNNFEQLNIIAADDGDNESSYEIPKKIYSFSSASDCRSDEKLTNNADSSQSINLNSSADDLEFKRNSSLTQSMFSNVEAIKLLQSPVPAVRTKIKSCENLCAAAAEAIDAMPIETSSLTSSNESLPCPSFPPPPLKLGTDHHIYGQISKPSNKYASSTDDSDCPRRPPIRHKRRTKDIADGTAELREKYKMKSDHELRDQNELSLSNRATVDSNEFTAIENRLPKIFSRNISSGECCNTEDILLEEKSIPLAERSESWNFYDHSNTNVDCDDARSSPEPIYANDQSSLSLSSLTTAAATSEPVYGLICNVESPLNTLLTPQQQEAAPRKKRSKKPDDAAAASSSSADILKEFDPLVMTTVDQIFSNKSNELILLENLLGEETYVSVTIKNKNQTQECSELNNFDTSSEDTEDDYIGGDRDNDDDDPLICPPPPQRQDSLADPKNNDRSNNKSVIIHQNIKLRCDSLENMLAEDKAVAPYLANLDEPSTLTTNDLNNPPPSRTNWFLNDNDARPSTSAAANKMIKSNDIAGANKNSSNLNCDPPSYSEAMGNETTEITVKPIASVPQNQTKSSVKSMFTNVLTKMEGINLGIRRKSSFKNLPSTSETTSAAATTSVSKSSGGDVKVILEMIPRPALTNNLTMHEGHLVRFPSGVVDDILKEQQFRKAYLRDRKFQTYFDKDPKNVKENIPLEYITTIQRVSQQKFTGTNSIEMHCFEITTAIPPKSHIGHMSNPNMMMTSTTELCGNVKTQRVCHLYGVPKETERFVWMQKLLESLTDVFPTALACKYYRAGWCYLKNSITSQWSGAWILLQKQKRKLVCYSMAEMNLESLDLRKARCLVLKDNDDSIRNLHVESGPILMIDCPPYSMYMIMSSPRETKIWRHIIREVAHNNGSSLKDQQLTKDNVPVLVDKCINFIYAHGSMSEGIYRKSGSENSIQKLLTLFRTDAFNVQIIRSEYNEHDAANVLKRFMRDLPDRFLGKYSVSFISVSKMKSKLEKINAYKELLYRLPAIEYHTLKKLIGHLNFIQSQKQRNKMGIDNLAIIWGPTLLHDQNDGELTYSQDEANVIVDLITLYKNLYQLTVDEVAKEQIMLQVLKKYHAAAENLSDSVKQSGDLKVWITIDPNPGNDTEEKQQINVTLTPTKTVYDICKELAPKMKCEAFDVTLYEIILNDTLHRPLHYSEKVFDIVLRWSYWPESDRKNNYLQLRPMKFMKDIQRALKNLPIVSPNKELKFADIRTKSFKSYTLELIDGIITVMKKEKNVIVKIKEINLKLATAYIGCEKKRDFQSRWAITLIENAAPNANILRTRESPYIGHVIAGTNSNDSIVWYSSILHSLYGDDIMPNPEIVMQ